MNPSSGLSAGNVSAAMLAVYLSLGIVWVIVAVTLHLIYKRVRPDLYLKYWYLAWYMAVIQLSAFAIAFAMGDASSRLAQGLCMIVGSVAGYFIPAFLILSALAMRGPVSRFTQLVVIGCVFGLALAFAAAIGVASSHGLAINKALKLLYVPRSALGALAGIWFAIEYYRQHSGRPGRRIRYLIPLLCISQSIHQILLAANSMTNGSYSLGSIQAALVSMLIGVGITITLMYGLTVEAQSATTSKSAFLATMSHEMRTPLAGLIGLNALLADSDLNAGQKKLSDSIGHCARSLLSLVDDILDLSRIEAGRAAVNMGAFDPKLLIDEVTSMLGATAASKGLTLSVEYESAMPCFVLTDRSIVKQILLNLVGNAIKFTNKGSVRVITSHPGEDARPLWRLEVQDTGCGIPASAMSKLFEPFYQANNSPVTQAGTGLGLHLSRRWAMMLGATNIEVHSELGTGSRFSVAIPAPLSQTGPAVESRPLALPERGGLKILVAEDNKVNQIVMLRLLEKLGHKATAVSDGQEAIEEWQKGVFDLVLMDLRMPGLDGLAATKEIRKLESGGNRIPIIAVTANAFHEDREKCLSADMDDYIAKPIAMDALAAIIKKWRVKQEVLS